MYLEHFKLKELPFTLTPNTEFFCDLPIYQEALNVLLVSLRSGEGFIKIVGEVGTGKTLLCRMLLNYLDNDFVTACIPNPDLTPNGLLRALAVELGIPHEKTNKTFNLLPVINEKLLALHQDNKQVVLIIDEAQTLSEQNLETVRLLTNLETETKKLLQVVLFGQPELDSRLNKNSLRQLKQRITFSYHLSPIHRSELNDYLQHRLIKAGYTYGPLFTSNARRLLYRYSRGLPRLINILSHKSLMVAYGKGEIKITAQAVRRAIQDSESVNKRMVWHQISYGALAGILISLIVFMLHHKGLHL